MTDLFYMACITIALAVFTFTAWVSSEGYLLWNEAVGCLLIIAAGIVCIFYGWHGDINRREPRHK